MVIKSERTFDGISLDKPGSDGARTGEAGGQVDGWVGFGVACGAGRGGGVATRGGGRRPPMPPCVLTTCPVHPLPPPALRRTVTYTRFALCGKCYSAEIAGQGKGLPPGMQLQELLPAHNKVGARRRAARRRRRWMHHAACASASM